MLEAARERNITAENQLSDTDRPQPRDSLQEKGVAGTRKEDGHLSWGAPEGNLCGENKRIIRLG